MNIPKTKQRKSPKKQKGILMFAISCILTAILLFIIVEIILGVMFRTLK
ncbi:hypothetical protein [Paenibacillus faecalis]|nr:hypothetical protein [Paenibacillus faecalis]